MENSLYILFWSISVFSFNYLCAVQHAIILDLFDKLNENEVAYS